MSEVGSTSQEQQLQRRGLAGGQLVEEPGKASLEEVCDLGQKVQGKQRGGEECMDRRAGAPTPAKAKDFKAASQRVGRCFQCLC